MGTNVIPGHQFQIAFSKCTEGTPAGTALHGVPAYSGAVYPSQSREFFQVADGTQYYPSQFISGAHAEGQVDLQLFPLSGGRLLANHFGAAAIAGTADPYTHTITLGTAGPQYMTMWTQRPLVSGGSEWDRHDDMTVKSIAIDWASGQSVHANCEFIGKNSTVDVAAPTVTSPETLDSTGTEFHWASADLSLDVDATPAATAIHNLTSFSLVFAYNDLAMITTDALIPQYRDPKRWFASVSMGAVMEDWGAYKSTFFGSKTASGAALSSTVARGALTFIIYTRENATPSARKLTIALPSLEFALAPPAPNVDGSALVAQMTGVLEKPSSGQPATLTLKNSRATSYA